MRAADRRAIHNHNPLCIECKTRPIVAWDSRYCVECEPEHDPDWKPAARLTPLIKRYRLACIMCSHDLWARGTEEAARRYSHHPLRCEHCGGMLAIEEYGEHVESASVRTHLTMTDGQRGYWRAIESQRLRQII